jgi:hypothetical protein
VPGAITIERLCGQKHALKTSRALHSARLAPVGQDRRRHGATWKKSELLPDTEFALGAAQRLGVRHAVAAHERKICGYRGPEKPGLTQSRSQPKPAKPIWRKWPPIKHRSNIRWTPTPGEKLAILYGDHYQRLISR